MHYSAARGTQTGVTPDDLRLLYTTLLNMFDHDRSATGGIMAASGLYTFSHTHAFGNAPAHTLISRITAEPTSLGYPQLRRLQDHRRRPRPARWHHPRTTGRLMDFAITAPGFGPGEDHNTSARACCWRSSSSPEVLTRP